MANKFPLIVNSTTNRIAELALGDNLDLSGSNISNVADINLSGSLNSSVAQLKITGGSANYVIKTDGFGNLSWTAQAGGGGVPNYANFAGTAFSVSGQNVTSAVSFATTANSVAGANVSGAVSSATTAGTVTVAAQPNITSTGTLISLNVSGSATLANTGMTKFNETVITGGNTGAATLAPDASAGSIYKYTVTGAITINALTNAVAGTSVTLILTQGGAGSFALTSSMKFAGGTKTLSTAVGAIDIISVFYDGTTYYASLTKGYA